MLRKLREFIDRHLRRNADMIVVEKLINARDHGVKVIPVFDYPGIPKDRPTMLVPHELFEAVLKEEARRGYEQ